MSKYVRTKYVRVSEGEFKNKEREFSKLSPVLFSKEGAAGQQPAKPPPQGGCYRGGGPRPRRLRVLRTQPQTRQP